MMTDKTKILYVDDEEINCQLFEIHFNKKYKISLGCNGYKGLEILESQPDIKIIISDMRMPGMNGIEFIKKAKEKYPSKKYYILTGFSITDEIQSALDTGLVLKYFSKPFNILEIDQTISDALKTK